MVRHRTTPILVAAACACWFAPSAALADVFLLKSGGQVEGEWMSRGAPRAAGHEIRTRSGIRIRLPSDEVQERVPEPRLYVEAEYQRIAPSYGPSVEDQWRLAQWCRENKLPDRRKLHMEAILKLEPDHVAARRALGYQQFGGKWQTREQYHRQAGYELYRGRWRLSQDIEIQEEKGKRDLAQREWLVRLKRWRAELTSERAPQAYQRMERLNDPRAVPALKTLLTRETDRRIKIVYLDALLRIADAGAVHALLSAALEDKDEEVFFESADRLKKVPPHLLVRPLLDTLGDQDNVRLNRAAYLIGKTGDEKLVSPLIDVLVTTHRIIDRNGGRDTTSISADGGVGMSRGGPTYTDLAVHNRQVLDALVELTGQNFEFDQRAWRRWYNIEKVRIFAETPSVDLRRETTGQVP